ncbi:MAG TPA: hydrogenase maturation protease [Kofleriaceae bacterium]|nr:hydrogenase maturation protease [Kofleriaceae bacterium]
MTSERIDVLVLGLGNVLCGDDGAGVVVAHRLRRELELPPGVRVVDGGTLGLDLLALVAASERVILIDAVRADAAPGTIVRIAGQEVAKAAYERLSVHQIGVADLLAGVALCDEMPEEVVIVGVVPVMTDLQLGCTPEVASSLPALADAVTAELRRMGVETRRRVDPHHADDGARALGL